MSLLVALSLAERENGQCESSVYNLDSGDFLLKLLHGRPADEVLDRIRNQTPNQQTNQNQQQQPSTAQRPNVKTIIAGETDAEMFEMLTATTPRKFSHLVRQRSIFSNSFANQITPGYIPNYIADTMMSTNDRSAVMYQKRNILDLGANLVGSNSFVGPARMPRTKKAMLENRSIISWLSGEKPLPTSMEICADADCKFQEPVYEKKPVQQ